MLVHDRGRRQHAVEIEQHGVVVIPIHTRIVVPICRTVCESPGSHALTTRRPILTPRRAEVTPRGGDPSPESRAAVALR